MVIYEDNNILVLEKPYGMVVNKADTTDNVATLQAWVEKYLKLTDLGIGGRAGIVHRLDKDTSGIIVVAKTEIAFENLQAQFKNREVVKRYTALVHGLVKPSSGTVNAPIDRNPFNRERFGIFPGGKEAVSDYKTITNYQLPITKDQFTLLEVTPHTGRTHQIRVHMKHTGHPIVSDEFYGGRKQSREDRKWCSRQFLHASYLKIKLLSGEYKEFKSDLPEDLGQALKDLTAI
jgi:23S rRNA pseudouridine1911/1915/1917 synthase